MAWLTLVRTPAGFHAADEQTRTAMNRIPLGTVITRKYSRPRSAAHHRFRFAWLNELYEDIEHMGIFGSQELLRAHLTLQTDHITVHLNPFTGEVTHSPKSWGYPPDGPDEERFRAVMNQIGEYFFNDMVPQLALRGQWTPDYTEQFCRRHMI